MTAFRRPQRADAARALAAHWFSEAGSAFNRRRAVPFLRQDSKFMRRLQAFADACDSEGVDPFRVLTALFDYSRKQLGHWKPAPRLGQLELGIHAAWEKRQAEARSGDLVARRMRETEELGSEAQRNEEEIRSRRPVVRKRFSSLEGVLDRDAGTYLRLTAGRGYLYPAAPVELNPALFSREFRALVDGTAGADVKVHVARLVDFGLPPELFDS